MKRLAAVMAMIVLLGFFVGGGNAVALEPATYIYGQYGWKDPATGLVWSMETGAGKNMTEAINFCASLGSGNSYGWGAPSLAQIKDLSKKTTWYVGIFWTLDIDKDVDHENGLYIDRETRIGCKNTYPYFAFSFYENKKIPKCDFGKIGAICCKKY